VPGRIAAYVDTVTKSSPYQPATIRILSLKRTGLQTPAWLHERAQVVLQPITPPGETNPDPIALNCDQEEGTLLCKMPGGLDYSRYKIWVDQAPYISRPGLWADTDISQLPDHLWHQQPYAAGRWQDIHEICTPDTHDCLKQTWTDWVASLELKNLAKEHPAYCIKEFEELPKVLSQQLAGVRRESQKSEIDLSFLNTGNKLLQQTPQQPYSIVKDSEKTCKSPIIKIEPTTSGILVRIPFAALSAIPEDLHLVRLGECDDSKEFCRVTLPDLRSSLLPGPVEIADLKQGTYRLTGDHLRAVDRVLLDGPAKTPAYAARVGFNNVDFTIPNNASKLTPGTYNVFLVIGTTTVPAERKTADGKSEQVSVTIEPRKEPGAKVKPPPDKTQDSKAVAAPVDTKKK